MGLIKDVGGIWSKSGTESDGIIDKILGVARKVIDTAISIVNIFAAAKERKNVISDYRKASVSLPKYYREEGLERVATIQVVEAIKLAEEKGDISKNKFVNDLAKGNTKDTFILKTIQESFGERHQIVETFGEDFGDWTCSGGNCTIDSKSLTLTELSGVNGQTQGVGRIS